MPPFDLSRLNLLVSRSPGKTHEEMDKIVGKLGKNAARAKQVQNFSLPLLSFIDHSRKLDIAS